jgi:hypothetical protein
MSCPAALLKDFSWIGALIFLFLLLFLLHKSDEFLLEKHGFTTGSEFF